MTPARRTVAIGTWSMPLWCSPGPTPTLLALHGFTGSGADFEILARHLRWGMIAPDLVGHGQAPAPPTLSPYRMAAVVDRLAKLCAEPDRPDVLLGYSMGGRVALSLAIAHPQSFSSLILVGATAGLHDPEARHRRRAADAALADRLEQIGVPAFLDEWARKPIIQTQQRIASADLAAMTARRQRCSATGLAQSLRGMGTGSMPDLWDRLDRLTIPVLVVVGEEDHKFAGLGARLVEALPHARLARVAGAGHCAHLEQPQATAALIEEFLDRLHHPR